MVEVAQALQPEIGEQLAAHEIDALAISVGQAREPAAGGIFHRRLAERGELLVVDHAGVVELVLEVRQAALQLGVIVRQEPRRRAHGAQEREDLLECPGLRFTLVLGAQ